MGKKDIITKKYLEQPEIFADAFNYYLFNGKNVIKPTDLKEQDPIELAVMKKMGKMFTNQKMRDVLRLCTIRHSKYATLVLLGIEGQSDISYVMPVRDYLYDALNYADQIENIRKKHMEAKDLNGADFISGFSGKDKLIPVITLCVCFDKTRWDGPKSLYDMFGKIDPQVRKYVNNYTLNLITPDEIEDFTRFSSGLGRAMEFIQNSSDMQKLRAIMETREEYKHVDIQTVDIINAYTDVKITNKNAEDGHMSMCAGMKGLIEEGRLEGREEGLEAGENMLANLIKLLKPGTKDYDKALNGTSADRKQLYKKYNIIV